MADAITNQILVDGQKEVVMLFTNTSDGTGESAILKVDVSTLSTNSQGYTCTGVRIDRITASTYGMAVQLLWDATTDVTAFVIGGDQFVDTGPVCDGFAPIPNNSGAGKTGDILFTTKGATANDTYSIMLFMTKFYA